MTVADAAVIELLAVCIARAKTCEREVMIEPPEVKSARMVISSPESYQAVGAAARVTLDRWGRGSQARGEVAREFALSIVHMEDAIHRFGRGSGLARLGTETEGVGS